MGKNHRWTLINTDLEGQGIFFLWKFVFICVHLWFVFEWR